MKKNGRNPSPKGAWREKTNLSLSKTLKYPGIELASEMGFSLSEFVERLLEVQLVKAKKLKRPFLDELVPAEEKTR